MEDGPYKQVFEGPITASRPWLRYVYSKFDFTAVKDPGLYVIEYADQRTAPFPISNDAYAKIWQDSLDHHLAEQMDHVSVREGYRVWHGASHLDDGRMAAGRISFFARNALAQSCRPSRFVGGPMCQSDSSGTSAESCARGFGVGTSTPLV